MEWEKPEFVEVSLACEISSYANAELPESPAKPSSCTPTNE
jgi:coenzyme PQQ precursor peptide PqqA